MRLRTLLDTEALGLRLLGGDEELDRTVRGVMTTDLRDPSRYLSGGELVLTGLAWRRGPEDSEPFVRRVVSAGVAALAAGEAEVGGVPRDLVEACDRHRLPLFAVDEKVAFAAITEHVVRQVSTGRAGDLAAVVDRHRRLMSSGPDGGGPDAVLDLLLTDLDLRAWVLSSTGRRIAGAEHELSGQVRTELAGEQLAARRAGRRRRTGSSRTAGPSRCSRSPAATRAFRAPRRCPTGCSRSRRTRPTGRRNAGTCCTASPSSSPSNATGATRPARYAAGSPTRSWNWCRPAPPPAEIAARLRVAAPVLLPGLGVGAALAGRGGPGRAGRDGEIPGGPVAQALLEEILVGPRSPAPGRQGADRGGPRRRRGDGPRAAARGTPRAGRGRAAAGGRRGPLARRAWRATAG